MGATVNCHHVSHSRNSIKTCWTSVQLGNNKAHHPLLLIEPHRTYDYLFCPSQIFKVLHSPKHYISPLLLEAPNCSQEYVPDNLPLNDNKWWTHHSSSSNPRMASPTSPVLETPETWPTCKVSAHKLQANKIRDGELL